MGLRNAPIWSASALSFAARACLTRAVRAATNSSGAKAYSSAAALSRSVMAEREPQRGEGSRGTVSGATGSG